MASTSDNHSKAPQSAEFVRRMRAAFGDVKVLYVREGDVVLGEEMTGPFASCFMAEPEKEAA